MPSIEDWLSNPLNIVAEAFENRQNSKEWKQKVEEFFKNKISDEKLCSLIPSLNSTPLHLVPSTSLVRFRCMIQDSFEPEYFLETYEVVNKTTREKVIGTSCYKDVIDSPDGYDVIMESPQNETGCRQVLFCVSIPGETEWVKQFTLPPPPVQGVVTSNVSTKRSHDDEPMEATEEAEDDTNKRRNLTLPETSVDSPNLEVNHPLPWEKGQAAIVKVYDETMDFKVNEVYEFVGILSVDPSLSAIHDTNHDQVNGDCGHMEELKSRSPPASLVPRIHVIAMEKLSHNNPLLSNNVSSVPDPPSTTSDDLLDFIRKATLGDELAAQCILFHLLSRVYTRSGTMAVGKLSLNISGIPPNSPFPKLFADVIKQLVTKCCYLPMTLDNMNKLRFVPNKNYTKNKLEPGVLQLSNGSYLLLDETSLKPGSLDSSGVKNIRAISTLVTTQKVDYDFQFYQTPFYHDVNCVVLSEAKSMLPCDLHIKLTPGFPVPENLVDYFCSLLPPVEVLNKFRIYLTRGRMVEYDMEPHVMQEIENDFVSWRRDDRDNVSADDLHRLLVLARVQCASMGRNKLSSGDWGVVKKFDEKRKERMKT
ncbi:mini-chromosome maintenance complex-binding protein [Ciona intestinalis]